MTKQMVQFGHTQDDRGLYDLDLFIDRKNEIVVLYANDIPFARMSSDRLFTKEEVDSIIFSDSHLRSSLLGDVVGTLVWEFEKLEVARSRNYTIHQSDDYVFIGGEAYPVDGKNIDELFQVLIDDGLIYVAPSHKQYVNELRGNKVSKDYKKTAREVVGAVWGEIGTIIEIYVDKSQNTVKTDFNHNFKHLPIEDFPIIDVVPYDNMVEYIKEIATLKPHGTEVHVINDTSYRDGLYNIRDEYVDLQVGILYNDYDFDFFFTEDYHDGIAGEYVVLTKDTETFEKGSILKAYEPDTLGNEMGYNLYDENMEEESRINQINGFGGQEYEETVPVDSFQVLSKDHLQKIYKGVIKNFWSLWNSGEPAVECYNQLLQDTSFLGNSPSSFLINGAIELSSNNMDPDLGQLNEIIVDSIGLEVQEFLKKLTF